MGSVVLLWMMRISIGCGTEDEGYAAEGSLNPPLPLFVTRREFGGRLLPVVNSLIINEHNFV